VSDADAIYFIRHGETDWNRDKRIQGHTDIPLNATGHGQARLVAMALPELVALATIAAFRSSPLLRARQTMDCLASIHGIDPASIGHDPDLRELGFGAFEGRSFNQLRADPEFPSTAAERYHWRPERGESYADGHERMRGWLALLERPAVIVAHGAIGRCLVGAATGLSPEAIVNLRIPQGFICRIADGEASWFDAAQLAS
jgi:probable phosphoglycerate mutase